MRAPDLTMERQLWGQGVSFIAGIDEVGRGPLAGPVAAGAVVLPRIDRITKQSRWLLDVRDSKQLAAPAREELSGYIWEHAVAAGVAFVPVAVIDRIGIAEASRQAWLGAISELAVQPAHLVLDAFRLPSCRLPQTAIIAGDEKIMSIACASIIAKVARDRLMAEHHCSYPGYGFVTNKGYATPEHFAALDRLGPCQLHRRSFSPVREMVTPHLPL
jgi:ribonuclease HII